METIKDIETLNFEYYKQFIGSIVQAKYTHMAIKSNVNRYYKIEDMYLKNNIIKLRYRYWNKIQNYDEVAHKWVFVRWDWSGLINRNITTTNLFTQVDGKELYKLEDDEFKRALMLEALE